VVELDAMRFPALVSLLLASTLAVDAATFVVTKETDDDGPCTPDDCALREAILAANALPGADVVELPPGEYQLSLVGPVPEDLGFTGDVDIRDDLQLLGDPLNPPVIVGDGTDRVIHAWLSSIVEISHVVVTGGRGSTGGGIQATCREFYLRHSSVVGNENPVSFGGGIYIAGVHRAVIESSTISGNTALNSLGGGIYAFFADVFSRLDIVNDTISGNRARSGGGLYFFSRGNYRVTNCTIADNEGTNPFSDGLVGDTSTRLTISNSLFSNNDCGYIGAVPDSNGHNVEGPNDTCFLPGSGDLVGVTDLGIGPLADNGGVTLTQALEPGSPALDAALDEDCPVLDQRGVQRPQNGDGSGAAVCDVGAFELESSVTEIPTLSTGALFLLGLILAVEGLFTLRPMSISGPRPAAQLRDGMTRSRRRASVYRHRT
jgi:CSLREA domain-containing protein